jgi:hypothetical protein
MILFHASERISKCSLFGDPGHSWKMVGPLMLLEGGEFIRTYINIMPEQIARDVGSGLDWLVIFVFMLLNNLPT